MKTETLRNRFTGKTVTVRVKINDKGLRYITARQYNEALAKLGHGPIAATDAMLVLTNDGRPYADISQFA